jgi:hypothetical protein
MEQVMNDRRLRLKFRGIDGQTITEFPTEAFDYIETNNLDTSKLSGSHICYRPEPEHAIKV